ncbi:3-hexulose-6-phosphate synthase [Tetragenococcus osmophilus]|uniref:3-hexulose-6-phosphate synthase n=1 Tax=Tetragenococcus osmophilus TaxID=526944 RepID=A0AA37XKL4_9ENTE|nr:3-hexulose-6-phosphate synthase [Tetragenococcus osmophilus]AYW48294.1 3-hexulose-6-phosphate synthase [Tetragenococcus osmophilus]GMA54098.1 3-hexulose-6-phosphate synthase [Alicyclobacillus contaminans]GMA72015.1 3-hexulose-6-phosphate synthase [Tetragenococcus osmophilus]
MKLQLAIDELSLEQALIQVDKLKQYIDIVEIGTPFLIDAGRKAVEQMKRKFPELEILCDAKIMDAGAYEAQLAYDAGADYVTVLGITDDLTIKGCVEQAKKQGRKVMVDMICVKDFATRIPALEELGVDVIAVHTGADQQQAGRTPIEDLIEMKKYVKKAQIAVAGGINSKTVEDYMALQPDIVIVGSGILNAVDPVHEVELVHRLLTD